MKVRPLRADLSDYLKRRLLVKRFNKQIKIFGDTPRHPSLHTEVLEPKKLRLYSFRLNKKFRAIFVFLDNEEVEIVDINDHYQ